MSYRLIISTPEGKVFDGQVRGISLRGTEGDLAVLEGHIPFITAVKACDCHIELAEGPVETYYTDGGILVVSEESVTLLSGEFGSKHDFDHEHDHHDYY